MPFLIAFSGLPGVGKSAIAKELSRRLPAVYLRVDEVEAALKRSSLKIHPAEEAGYLALAAIAKSNLKLGLHVVTDTVNPVQESRALWRTTAQSSAARLFNIEVVCSDAAEHRRRVGSRQSDIEALKQPSWQEVRERRFDPWTEKRLLLDSAALSIPTAAEVILRELSLETDSSP